MSAKKTSKDPIYEQGAAAADLGLPSTDCPYDVEGDNGKTWLLAHRDKTAELAAASDD